MIIDRYPFPVSSLLSWNGDHEGAFHPPFPAVEFLPGFYPKQIDIFGRMCKKNTLGTCFDLAFPYANLFKDIAKEFVHSSAKSNILLPVIRIRKLN
jgi:hypothetical protein